MSVNFQKDSDNIVTLTLDMPGRSMNVLNEALTAPFMEAIAAIEADQAVAGVIITSGKADFVAGADIEKLFQITEAQTAFELVQQFKGFLRRLELCGRPVVAALNGTALGGGLELALACHHRIAINNPKAKFGLPEVKLGLLPGGGGTQRLPRMIGIQSALQLMLEGKELRAEEALQQGIIQELASDREDLLAKAKAWCLANPKAKQPWDDKKFRWPGGDSRSPGNGQLWAIAPSMASAKTHGNYPAATNIMSCVFEGGIVDFDTGCEIESRYFVNCALSPVAKNMIGTLWFQLNAINKGKSRPEGIAPSKVSKVGILGAGMMGAGIAYASAKAGIQVVLLDNSLETAENGKDYSSKLLDKAIKRKQQTAEGKQALLDRIRPTVDFGDLASCDLIIEAVFEDLNTRFFHGLMARGQGNSDPQNRSADQRRRSVCLKHLYPADHRPGAGQRAAGKFHRPAFLLAGGQDAAGRNHRRPADQPANPGARLRLRAADQKNTDRGPRFTRLLHLARIRHLCDGRLEIADGRPASARHRDGGLAGRHAGGAAGSAR